MRMSPTEQGFFTQAVHAGYTPDPTTHARALPLYQTTSYTFDSAAHAASLFGLQSFGNIYTRLMNPTTDAFEQRITQLEGGAAAVAVASGHAAVAQTLLTLCEAGDDIVSSTDLYGGTLSLFQHSLPKLGIQTRFVNPHNLEAWEESITPRTKAFYVESLGNPKLDIVDIERIASMAHAHGIPLIVDNTVPTPYLLQPIRFGADIVIHSATKFIGGHGTSIGGVVIDAGRFDWQASGRFTSFHSPEPAYHGLNFVEAFGALAFILRLRTITLRNYGGALSPFNSWLFAQGCETLGLRIARQSETALQVAQWLQRHPDVAWVNYPGLPTATNAPLKEKYLPKGAGAIIGFGIRGEGQEAQQRAKSIVENVKLLSHVANIGDSRSLIIHPASTTHSQLNEQELYLAGVTPEFIRLSIGLEDTEDVIQDLQQAIEISRSASLLPASVG
ncbi:MAG: O-acetylhomoserine aminocarboxypropyltransferase/cysteine synthase family protein [Vampirovibrionales bacterium]